MLSRVRICSEHAIGFLKGQFSSLKDLRVHIVSEKSHKFATYWGLACIAIHNYAMTCEEKERHAQGNYNEDYVMNDPFLQDGLEPIKDEVIFLEDGSRQSQSARQRLSKGWEKREKLKEALFSWMDIQEQRCWER